ncbi:MAG: DUF5050 domain-containing protein [Christensenellales bacterium]|jgi:hypothetical protein
MKKRLAMIFILITSAAALCGCSLLQGITGMDSTPEPAINGTTTGNILNYGFAVKDGDDIIFVYTGQDIYDYGSVVRSDPKTGESSLVLDKGGLYMNLVDGYLFYCRKDGIYKTSLDTREPACILAGKVSLLQISDSLMYYVKDGAIDCATLDGQSTGFSTIENADCLNVYGNIIYYRDTSSGYICSAHINGDSPSVLYDQSVDMFYITDNVVYFIDSANGFIRKTELDFQKIETVISYPCKGFNVNRSGMYYTRDIEGESLCCKAVDGQQETVITDFGESAWHIACMWNEGAMVLREEDILGIE